MATFVFDNEILSITDEHDRHVELGLQEIDALLLWALDHQEMLLERVQSNPVQRDTGKGHIEIQLQQPYLMHLDTLKAAIPDLQPHPSVATSFVAPIDSVTQRGLELLKECQIEYKIHPLLEDFNEFAQG